MAHCCRNYTGVHTVCSLIFCLLCISLAVQLCLVLLWSEHHQLGYELLDKLQSELNSEQLLLLRTRVVPYSAKDKNKLNGMFKKNEALVKAAMKGKATSQPVARNVCYYHAVFGRLLPLVCYMLALIYCFE